MLHVQALHLADQRPYIYEDRWISLSTAAEIQDVDLKVISANEWLVQNKPYDKNDLRIYAKKSDKYDSEILNIPSGEALLVLERTTWIYDQLITCLKAITRPDYQMLAKTY